MIDVTQPGLNHGFDDILAANAEFAAGFKQQQVDGYAHRGLAIVTCFDSRIDPLRIVGMSAGDAKIVRNAGARVTDDVLRTLVLATHLLGVTRVLVMPHTDCRMSAQDEHALHASIYANSGVDTRSLEFRTSPDQASALLQDLQRIRSYPLLPTNLQSMGAVYDVRTGTLAPIVEQA